MPKGIKYYSFWEPSGYGAAGRRYLSGLLQTGIPVSWTPLVPGREWGMWYQLFKGTAVGDPVLDQICNLSIDYDTVVVHTMPEYFPFCLQREREAKVFGLTVWETTRLPKHWPQLLNAMHGLMVPCQWNRRVFFDSGVQVPIAVVPHAFEMGDEETVKFSENIADDEFVFYSINTWTNRKAVWNTVRAYLTAFDRDDPVVLVLKTSRDALNTSTDWFSRNVLRRMHQSTRTALAEILQEFSNPARIVLLTDFCAEAQISALHRRGDCYVSLCRSEGWGMGAFDAGGYGNPVIMTGFGGQLDYLSAENSYLTDFKPIPVVEPNSSYTPDQTWAEPDLAHAAQLLRYVYSNRLEAAECGRRLQRSICERFSAERVTDSMLTAIASNANDSSPGESQRVQ